MKSGEKPKKRKIILIGGVIFIALMALIARNTFFPNKVKTAIQGNLGQFMDMENEERIILNNLNEEWVFPKGYTLESIEHDGLKMNWIHEENSSSDKVILQLHGGAYRKSLTDYPTMYQRTAVKYAEISHARVLTIDYRVAPPHPFPAALDDAVLAYKWLLDNGYNSEDIIIAGDSAGGGLTLATALYLRDNNIDMPAALITMSAWTNLNYKKADIAYVGNNNAENPYISPIYGDYTGLPQMLMQVGGDEFILKDTTTVAQKAKDVGSNVVQSTSDGMFHDFQMLFPVNTQANKAWDEVEAYIKNIYK
jgi:epsilon-lactone hydrolase